MWGNTLPVAFAGYWANCPAGSKLVSIVSRIAFVIQVAMVTTTVTLFPKNVPFREIDTLVSQWNLEFDDARLLTNVGIRFYSSLLLFLALFLLWFYLILLNVQTYNQVTSILVRVDKSLGIEVDKVLNVAWNIKCINHKYNYVHCER